MKQMIRIVEGLADSGWSVRTDSKPLIISANEYRNPSFAPNVTVFEVDDGDPIFTVPSTSVELSRSLTADGPIRGRQVIIDYSMETMVTYEIVVVEAADGFVQIVASAANGDVELTAQFLESLLFAAAEGVSDV
jgi:hypothetical protein